MISRRTAKKIAELYQSYFTFRTSGYKTGRRVSRDSLYDYLFEHDYPAYICNMSKKLIGERSVLEWVMQMHTGESLYEATKSWERVQREMLGQKYLKNLAEDFLNCYYQEAENFMKGKVEKNIDPAIKSLELDGYKYIDNTLLISEADVLDTQEEGGILKDLYTSLGMDDQETVFHHLKLSGDHYIEGRWDDSISNSRKFLECVLAQVAAKHHTTIYSQPLDEKKLQKPVVIRDYLEKEGLLESKEKEALRANYGLLSKTGGHPYMAENEQARLLRHIALTFSQFVMLRLKGKLDK